MLSIILDPYQVGSVTDSCLVEVVGGCAWVQTLDVCCSVECCPPVSNSATWPVGNAHIEAIPLQQTQ